MKIMKIQLLFSICFILVFCISCSSNSTHPQTLLPSTETTIPTTSIPSPAIPSLQVPSTDEILVEDNDDKMFMDNLISQYYGSIEVQDALLTYKIMTLKIDDYNYVIELHFFDYVQEKEKDGLIQSITYNVGSDFMPETIRQGLEIKDVNRDGSDDIILHLGLRGQARFLVCFVYDLESHSYTKLKEIDEVPTPNFSDDFEYVYGFWKDGPGGYGVEKYLIHGDELDLMATLRINYEKSDAPQYTEQRMIDGELVETKKNVSYKEIDKAYWEKHFIRP